MRAILLILILAVVGLLIAVASGFLDISLSRPAKVPDVSVNGASVTAKGGQAPTFDVETGSVAVGTKPANVTVPTVDVIPPDQGNQTNQTNQASRNAG